ncbi:MAG: helix-turn-helix transcriptional regulator [Clostridia bacterium]|nr:helix-turn-helix transcriptional regulator [Clostridia bacterium]
MDAENIEFGRRIRTMREYQKLSREKLAETANISTQFLADIENGKKGMSALTLKKICTALHTTSDSILFSKSNISSDSQNINDMLNSVPIEKQEEIEEIVKKIIRIV